jgi:formylglycine-generating enzyme required for sulfatase activity
MFRPNDKIGSYTLIQRIGRGQFGEVWLAEKRTSITTTTFALKFPLQEDIDLDVIKQEAAMWVKASGHPNVLPIIEADIHDEQIVIASEYAPDGSLKDWLTRHGGKAPSLEAAVKMMDGILAGLEHLHSKPIVHRDLKPANILLQGDMPKLADFGLSRILKTVQSTQTQAGTPLYMSPEAWRRDRSSQIDLWAAAVIFYQLLCGEKPFEGDDIPSLMYAILTEDARPLPNETPKPIGDFVAIALKKNPKERYLTVSAMREALQTAYQQGLQSDKEQVEPDPQPTPEGIVNFAVIGIIVAILLGIGAGVWGIVKLKSGDPGTSSVTQPVDTFVQIPAGEFLMGSEYGANDQMPAHKVKITRSFEIGKYEVTQAQWETVMRNNPSRFKGANLPVERVSWDDAQEFIKKLNAKNDGYVYRLPTEAEWEYACRAESTGGYAGNLDEMVWYDKNSGSKTHNVGEKKPNVWGVYDMHGNVWEWCADWYDGGYYAKSPDADPKGPDSGSGRVLRGGGWRNDAVGCRSAYRLNNTPVYRFDSVGFRLVRTNP